MTKDEARRGHGELDPATLCVHGGWRPDEAQRAAVLPLVRSSTFQLFDDAYAAMVEGRADEAWIYSRLRNPTLDAVQEKLAALEGAERALLFASGMAAIHAATLACVGAGDRIVAPRSVYGSTWDLFKNLLGPLGVRTDFVDQEDEAALLRALDAGPVRLVWAESLSNPTMAVADLPRLAALAHARGARLVVDATFVSPLLQRPLALGADLVVHSATKYLAGHSDLVGGVVCGGADLVKQCFRKLQLAGGCMDPQGAWLLDRGVKTLHLRMARHCEGSLRLARRMEAHPDVLRVLHPGLESHPRRELAARLLPRGSGGMWSMVLAGGDARALRFVRALRLALEASSLGGVETLVSLPFNTSHARLDERERVAAGIAPGFVRVSTGIEEHEDLARDFEAALSASRGA
jgi:cystathionine beta-lyase/cystathionine gamma-synthase